MVCLLYDSILYGFTRYPVDGNFLYQSKGVGLHYLVVFIGSCCSQMGFGAHLCK